MGRETAVSRLSALSRELSALLGELVPDAPETPFPVVHAETTRLRIDGQAYIDVNPDSGRFRLVQQRTNASPVAIETASRDLLFDYVINRLSGLTDTAEQPESRLAMRALVGCTLESVERALILSTLTQCRGNRTDAARVLGISIRTMRNKLRLYREVVVESRGAAMFHSAER
jgi:hypothetical protein